MDETATVAPDATEENATPDGIIEEGEDSSTETPTGE